MENASFSNNEEENERIKNKVRLYFDTWAGMQAYSIDELLELADAPIGYEIKELERHTLDYQAIVHEN